MIGEIPKRLVYIGSDHAGFEAKSQLVAHLQEKGLEVTDLGCFTPESCDYPDIAREVGEKVLEHNGSVGIIICGTGIGVSMAANKLRGIRAAMATDENLAEMARRHNDANVLTMGARTTDIEKMKMITDKFLSTDFESDQERHVRRVQKIDRMNRTNKPEKA